MNSLSTTADTSTPPRASRGRAWLRGLLAGPLSFVCAVLVMSGGALWLPGGKAGIDNLVLPIGLFPLIWTLLFLYSLIDPRLGRAYAVVGGLLLLHGAMIALHLLR